MIKSRESKPLFFTESMLTFLHSLNEWLSLLAQGKPSSLFMFSGWSSTSIISPTTHSRSTFKNHVLHPEDGGGNVLYNVGILLQHYMESQPRKPQSECSLL